MGALRPPGGVGLSGRCWAALAATAVVLALGASPGSASAATGALWVTQRDVSDASNVQAFTIGSLDDLLTGPLGVGTGGHQSYGIAVTPDDRYVYVTNDNGQSTVSQYSVSPTTGDLTALSPATVSVSASAGANPESIAIDPTGSWAFTANPGSGTVSTLRIAPTTGELTTIQEIATGLTQPTGIAVDPSGQYVYATDLGSDQVTEFSVDLTTGALTELGTVTVPQGSLPHTPAPIRIATAEIGGNGYAFVTDNSANDQVVEFTIDSGTGLLTEATWASPDGVSYPNGAAATDTAPIGVAVNTNPVGNSHDPYLYVAAGKVDEYDITPSTGALNSDVSVDDTTGSYATGNASAVAIAPDANELYVGNSGAAFISLFNIAADGTLSPDSTPTVASGTSPTTPAAGSLPTPSAPPTPVGGALTQIASPNDCVTSDALGCNTLIPGSNNSLQVSYQPVISADGKNAYVVSMQGDLDEFSRDPSTGALTYMDCITAGATGCTAPNENVAGIAQPQEMALSPDGKSAYVVTTGNNALVTFTRDTSTGALTFASCVSSTGAAGCTAEPALDNPYGVTVSPDGNNVYTTSGQDSAISTYHRASNGTLTFVSCLTTDAAYPDCGTDTSSGELASALTVVASPDNQNVYVAAGGLGPGGDVVEFSRNPSTGALTQLSGAGSCITTGTANYPNCGSTSAIGFDGGTEDLAVTPDGKNVYATAFADNGVIELRRNAGTGALTQLAPPNACLAEEVSPSGSPSCTQPPYPQRYGTAGALGVAVSPDGLDVYVSGAADNAVASFSRDPATGALAPIALPFGCITGAPQYTAGTCPQFNANGLFSPRRLAVSPDGNSVYVANQGSDGVVQLTRQLPADLALSESGAPGSQLVGAPITYTYTVTDGGPAAASGPVLTIPLAGGLSLVSATPSQGSCSGTATVTCHLGSLAAAGTATVHITANPASAGTASVGAAVADPLDTNTYNNSVTTSTTITNPPAKPSLPPPVLQMSTDVAPVSGTVLVELLGTTIFVPLSQAENIPMGSTIDATAGTVALTIAVPGGATEIGNFYDGEFVVTQDATGRVFATLTGGSFAGCPRPGKAGKHHKGAQLHLATAKKKPTTVVRQLWGNAHGDFTTKGRYGSAAVSGTVWLTQDRCDGTFFKVTKDTIVVTANARPHKHHLVKQGQSHLVHAPGF